MQITVKLFASFRLRLFKEAARECPPGATAADVAAAIGIPVREIGIVLVNGRHATLNEALQEGDLVALMPHIGGG